MAMRKIPSNKKGGPYLTAALFCENTLEDKDGTVSAVRIIDSIKVSVHWTAPPTFPSKKDSIPVSLQGLLVFKTGYAGGGERTVRLVMESPSGKSQAVLEQIIVFTPQPHGGANLRLASIIVRVFKGGLFWMHVFLDGKKMASVPIQINVERLEKPTEQAPANHKPNRKP